MDEDIRQPSAEDDAAYEAMCARAADSNLDASTLLATDYLNHFNEIVMLLEMMADMPDVLEDAKEWQPKTYVEHFQDSTIADKDLAIEAYPLVPVVYKQPFEHTVGLINELIANTVQQLDEEIAAGDMERVRETAVTRSRNIQKLMDFASAVMHGSSKTIDQAEVDQLMQV